MAVDVLTLVTLVGVSLVGAGWIAHRLGLPPALGYLAVGMAFAPSVDATPDMPTEALSKTAELAVLPLLFFIGLELDLRTLRRVLSETAVASVLNILIPTAAVMAAAFLWGWGTTEALVLGLAVSLSSTIFGERLSGSAGFPREIRQRVLGILIAEDVAAGAILALLAVLGGVGEGLGGLAYSVGRLVFLLVLATAAALLVIPRLLDAVARTHSEELVVMAGVVVILGFGVVGEFMGSIELGAFVAGMAAAEAGSRFAFRNRLSPMRDVALAIFFLAAGLHVNTVEVLDHWRPVLAIAALFLAAKLVVHVPAAMANGANLDGGLRTFLGLGTIGEFSLILAAAAANVGVGHPLLETYIVGVMVVLLVATPLLLAGVGRIVQRLGRLPGGIRKPMGLLMRSLRRSKAAKAADPRQKRQALRIVLANLLLLAAWGALAVWAVPQLSPYAPGGPVLGPSLVFGVALAVALPILYRTYRAYRDLVHLLVGMQPGEREGMAKVRVRLVDAWVAGTAFLLLVPVSLVAPGTLPVLLAGLFLAVIIATLAWRQLVGLHQTLEGTVTRVLGRDAESGALLDQVLEKYPWGVRFTAVSVPPGSPVGGQTLGQSRIAELTGATMAVLQRRSRETVNPGPDQVLMTGDTLVLMGDAHQLARAEALVVAHGEALRLTVQSRIAGIVEVQVEPGSPLIGQRLGTADLRHQSGALVVGVWPAGAPHPLPYRSDLVLQAGDQLILLGSPLQIERARELARPPPAPPSPEATSG